MRKVALFSMLLALGFTSLVLPSSARAEFSVNANILNGNSIGLTPTDFNPTTQVLNGKNPFQIEQFNPNNYQASAPPGQHAVLTGVGVTLNYSFHNTISITFTNPATSTEDASGIMHLTMPDKTTDLVGTPTFGTSVQVVSNPGDKYPFTTGSYIKDTSGVAAMKHDLSQPQVLAAFTGNGTINVPVFATATSSFSTTSGNGVGSSTTYASASISVVYYYAFVPEPSSMVLTGLGGVGLLLACRRGRHRRKDDRRGDPEMA